MKQSIFLITLFSILFLASCEEETSNEPDIDDSCFDIIDLGAELSGANKTIFINENEGWVLGLQNDGDFLNTLIHTDNGGSSWTVMNTTLPASHDEIKFVNATDGYLIDNNSNVRYTTDKGATWTEMVIPNPNMDQLLFYATASNSTTTVMLAWVNTSTSVLFFVSNTTHNITNTVVLNDMIIPGHNMHLSENGDIVIAPMERAGQSNKEIAYSSDNGANWNYTEILSEGSLSTESWVCDMSFPDDNTGYFTGKDGGYDQSYIYKTTDGGSNWTKKDIPGNVSHYNFTQISFANATNGLGIGLGSVHKTTDGGNTWTEFSCFSDNYISTSSVSYPVLDHGFICGLNGASTNFSYRIYKYTGQ